MEIDYDYLRTGTAIGFRASRELCSNYLFVVVTVKNGYNQCAFAEVIAKLKQGFRFLKNYLVGYYYVGPCAKWITIVYVNYNLHKNRTVRKMYIL